MTPELLERLTVYLWLAGAFAGVGVRIRRLVILHGLAYDDPEDQAYLMTTRRSSWLRLSVKVVLLAGAITNYLGSIVPPTEGVLAVAFWTWRLGVDLVVILLLIEDLGVDRIRQRLGAHGRRQRERMGQDDGIS